MREPLWNLLPTTVNVGTRIEEEALREGLEVHHQTYVRGEDINLAYSFVSCNGWHLRWGLGGPSLDMSEAAHPSRPALRIGLMQGELANLPDARCCSGVMLRYDTLDIPERWHYRRIEHPDVPLPAPLEEPCRIAELTLDSRTRGRIAETEAWRLINTWIRAIAAVRQHN